MQQLQVPVDDEEHCVTECQALPLVSSRDKLHIAIRRAWPTAPLNTFRQYCEAAVELHNRGAHKEKHRCVLFIAQCFRQAYKCYQNPVQYDRGYGAAPESVSYYDSFSSSSVGITSDLFISVADLMHQEANSY